MPESKTYSPELLPRRGEFTAWALTIASTLGLYFLAGSDPVPLLAWFFVVFFAFSAASISLGNWMDRRTFIHIGSDGLIFENGLRKIHFSSAVGDFGAGDWQASPFCLFHAWRNAIPGQSARADRVRRWEADSG
jgi:hypothetical protein